MVQPSDASRSDDATPARRRSRQLHDCRQLGSKSGGRPSTSRRAGVPRQRERRNERDDHTCLSTYAWSLAGSSECVEHVTPS